MGIFEDGQRAENPQSETAVTDQFTRKLPVDAATLKEMIKPINLPTYRLVSEVMLAHWDVLQPLLEAAWPEDAIEGTLDADDYSAAFMIRELARKERSKYPLVSGMKLNRVKAGMKRALSEMQMGRHQRRVEA